MTNFKRESSLKLSMNNKNTSGNYLLIYIEEPPLQYLIPN